MLRSEVPIPIATVGGENLTEFNQTRLEDLEEYLPSTNIELLRDPQGTLFGKNTTAGVLNISTAQPTFEPEANVEGSYGNYGYYQLRAAASDALVSDTLAGRISLIKTYQRGFVQDVTDGRDLDGINRSGVRAQLLWKPEEALSIRIIIDDAGEKEASGADVIYSLGPQGGTKYLNAATAAGTHVVFDPNYETTIINGPQAMQSDNSGYSLEANLKLGGFTVTSISA